MNSCKDHNECECGNSTIKADNIHYDERDNPKSEWQSNISFHSESVTSYYDLVHNMVNLYNSNTTQVFHGNSKSYNPSRSIIKSDVIKTQKIIQEYNFKLFTHTPNMLNISNISNRDKVISRINKDLELVNLMNGSTILHSGSGTIEDARDTLSLLNVKPMNSNQYPLLLENCAQIKGRKTSKKNGGTIKEMKDLIEGFDHIGICIDTQHLFAHGEYNIEDSNEVDRFFSDFDHFIGIEKLKLIHLNDSLIPKGNGSDLHDVVGNGYIWSQSFSSLQRILEYANYIDIPVVIETISDISQLQDVRNVYNTLCDS